MGRTAKKITIVGIGGSAGSLEALEQFFAGLPPNSGMAFVVVLHLDPSQKDVVPGLLRRFAKKMTIVQAQEGMTVQANSVYVIPPNTELSIRNGRLRLSEPSMPRALRMPVDFFMKSLAEDQGEQAVGIILSGMGTDGTMGLKAIREKLGLAMVQSPDSARYDSMPKSAIDTGLADCVASPKKLPIKLIQYVRYALKIPRTDSQLTSKNMDALRKICLLLATRSGHDFSLYKKSMMWRRVEKRMNLLQMGRVAEYVRYLRKKPQELDILFRGFLIGVTKFFRDPEAFDVLKEKVIRPLLINRDPETPIRVWVPACATGEEAYSLAILFAECGDQFRKKGPFKIQIYATDIDKEAVAKARLGLYPANIAADLSPQRLKNFFLKEDRGYRIRPEIREMVVFAPHDLLMDPPFTKLDLLSCRNLLIYLEPNLQKKILTLFHYTLSPGGVLFLGPSENGAQLGNLLSVIDRKWKVFQRKESALALKGIEDFPPQLARGGSAIRKQIKLPIESTIPDLVRRQLLEHYAPPAVLIHPDGDILYIHGRTGKYLELPPGKATMNIFTMAHEGFRFELGMAIRKASIQKTDIVLRGITMTTNGGAHSVTITVKSLIEPEAMSECLLVTFEAAPPSPVKGVRGKKADLGGRRGALVKELQEELKYTKDQLQSTIEDMEISHEELKSANEELQSSNEELQSTNEELGTSKEEMQLLNEELAEVNAELQAKIEDLSKSNSMIKNLFDSTDAATLFLDGSLNLRLFTPPATKLMNVIPTDVGRPITHIVSNLQYTGLVGDLTEVLKTSTPKEAQVRTADGRWFLMRIFPYRTVTGEVDGVVMTLTDITSVKQLHDLDKLKDEFVGSVSHELRAPLACIKMAGENLLDGVSDPLTEKQMEVVRIIDINVTRVARMVDRLLDLSRLESGKVKPACKSVNMGSLIQEAVSSMTELAQERHISIKTDAPAGLPAFSADPDMISEVLFNLIDNALRFARGQVVVSAGLKDKNIEVSVDDDGDGIAAKDIHLLFNKFGQIKRAVGNGDGNGGNVYKGTGLGLAISKEIVELHNGRIWAESAPGQGTRFHFALPIKQGD